MLFCKKNCMKNAALALNAVLLVAVAVLFYLFFSSKNRMNQPHKDSAPLQASADHSFKIGYFDLDLLESHFKHFNGVKKEISQKKEANTREKMRLRQQDQDTVNSYQKKQLSQQESEMATRELRSLEE